jgi:hypothetical protein
MKTHLMTAAAMAMAVAPVAVTGATAAQAAETCSPTVSINKPLQDAGSGWVTFQADFSVCATTRIKVKWRDRDHDTPGQWHVAAVTYPGGNTNRLRTGDCVGDTLAHRYVAYATLKVDGQLIAQTAKVFLRSKAVLRCGTWNPTFPD